MFCAAVNLKRNNPEERSSDTNDQYEKVKKRDKIEIATGDTQPQKLVENPGSDACRYENYVYDLSRPRSSTDMFAMGNALKLICNASLSFHISYYN